jgi:hypothetical protein
MIAHEYRGPFWLKVSLAIDTNFFSSNRSKPPPAGTLFSPSRLDYPSIAGPSGFERPVFQSRAPCSEGLKATTVFEKLRAQHSGENFSLPQPWSRPPQRQGKASTSIHRYFGPGYIRVWANTSPTLDNTQHIFATSPTCPRKYRTTTSQVALSLLRLELPQPTHKLPSARTECEYNRRGNTMLTSAPEVVSMRRAYAAIALGKISNERFLRQKHWQAISIRKFRPRKMRIPPPAIRGVETPIGNAVYSVPDSLPVHSQSLSSLRRTSAH